MFATQHQRSKQNVAVIFTTIESTLSALKEAAALADQWNARLTLIVPDAASRAERPQFGWPWRFHVVTGGHSVEAKVRVCCCRDAGMVPKSAIEPRSIVVIGKPKHWWLTRERRLARRLRNAGLDVVFSKA